MWSFHRLPPLQSAAFAYKILLLASLVPCQALHHGTIGWQAALRDLTAGLSGAMSSTAPWRHWLAGSLIIKIITAISQDITNIQIVFHLGLMAMIVTCSHPVISLWIKS